MARKLVLLEDTPGRVRAVEAWLESRPELELVHYARASEMIAWLEDNLAEAALISLDYHLGGAGPGAGSGFDVALWLAKRDSATCPVIVHTSDTTAATYVREALQTGGWSVVSAPFSAEGWGELAASQLKSD